MYLISLTLLASNFEIIGKDFTDVHSAKSDSYLEYN